MGSAIPIQILLDLYLKEKWPVPWIATHFKVSRQAIYERLRKAGMKLEKRSVKTVGLTAEQLRDLYCNKKLTMREIAKQFGISADTVSLQLHRFRFPIRRGGERRRKHPNLSSLKIGEFFLIEKPVGKHPGGGLYLQAKNLGIRIVIRRFDDTKIIVKRTQLLNSQTVHEMQEEGMTTTAIAVEFMADRKTIGKLLREKF